MRDDAQDAELIDRGAERRLAAQYGTLDALVAASSLEQGLLGALAAIGEHLDWASGAAWLVDPDGERLRFLALWSHETAGASAFEILTRASIFHRGEGLPGRIWASGQPAWIENVCNDSNFPRLAAAAEVGLHGAVGMPILHGRVLGVLEFFSPQIRPPDARLLRLFEALGHQLGQFVVRVQAEEALRESHARLAQEVALNRSTVDAALDCIVTIDDQGCITQFNPAAESTFGYAREEVLGQEMTDLIVPPEMREAHRRGMARYLETGDSHILGQRIELPAMRKDGTVFPSEIAILRLPIPGPPMFTSYLRDLTARKRLEEQERVIEAMRRTEVLKDQFLSILSHELRTPINAILGFGSIILDGVAGPISDDARRYTEKMVAGGDTLLALVNDLLDMTRIQAGRFHLDPAPMALGEVVRGSLESVAPLAERKGHRLVEAVPRDLPEMRADRQRVGQMLLNLLSNAIKFTDPGGVITVSASLEGERLRVAISDTGPGIAAEDIPRLFTRFTQLDSSSTRKAGGTGLGLSIVKGLAEAHGGEVGVESEPGAGSTFWFTLPLPGPAS